MIITDADIEVGLLHFLVPVQAIIIIIMRLIIILQLFSAILLTQPQLILVNHVDCWKYYVSLSGMIIFMMNFIIIWKITMITRYI